MKKRTIKLAVLSLMMTAMLFNCKKDDEPTDPKTPSTETTQALNAITLPAQTLIEPAAVQSTPASIEASAKATEVSGALGNIASTGVVPASVTTAASDVSGALSQDEINTLNSVNAETISAVAGGGELSPALAAILDKVMANPALAAYLPKFNFPTVNGVAVRGAKKTTSTVTASGARTSGTDAVEKVEGVLVDDACITAANTLFNTAKARLDASKATEDAKVATKYAADIAPIAAAQTACTDGLTATYAGYRTSAQQIGADANAALDAAQGVLGSNYALLKALVSIQVLGTLASINELEAADRQACIAKAAAATTNAQAARDANIAQVNAAYTTALAEATRLQGEAIRSCHNQGGGN
ncbi:hypothetical protein L0657_24110 [Dyadobacter sp. CY345]|uniref:hypothetical protein n=1 Tax=Dyadobacter sp. CY345 TaxID=2909335 RepID=UPI001F417A55|nr:hypothetical protein [Dyadobacter sp. CY345]MCF2447060.1 hypothetical protein [Dyadobacter sp. CY345]